MSSVVDITAARRAEERQRQQNEQLQHAARLASVGEMASTLAHELNQPLMAMSSFAGAARAFSAQGKTDALADCLDGLRTQAQRAREIIDRVREMARKRSTVFAPVALNEVVRNVLTWVGPELRRHQVSVSTVLDDSLPPVNGDRILLEQVLVNLLLNAMQALSAVAPAQRQIDIATASNDTRVLLSVADHGPGVPAAAAERLFEPFNTTRPQGLGLGLSICRTIVESHGGRIGHAPRDGGGAVFTIQLPIEK
jgi:C4-dicarboxylate-specific signal transduction histidine kinase